MVVYIKRLSGLSLIELLIALAISSSLFIIVTVILTASHKAELNLFTTYQSVDSFAKISGILENDCMKTRKSLQLIKRFSVISHLKTGIQLGNETLKFIYLNSKVTYLSEDMQSHDKLVVNKDHFKSGDLIMLYDSKDMQLAKIKSVYSRASNQLIVLEGYINIKMNKGASVAKIYQHTFYFEKNAILLVENNSHKVVLTNDLQLTNLFYLLNNKGHFSINKFEENIPPESRPAGFIIKWRAKQSNAPLANFWCLMS